MSKLIEKNLDILDVWESPNGNLFIKISEEYSIAIGRKGSFQPEDWELKKSQYVKSNDIVEVKKVGEIKWN